MRYIQSSNTLCWTTWSSASFCSAEASRRATPQDTICYAIRSLQADLSRAQQTPFPDVVSIKAKSARRSRHDCGCQHHEDPLRSFEETPILYGGTCAIMEGWARSASLSGSSILGPSLRSSSCFHGTHQKLGLDVPGGEKHGEIG